MATDPGVLREFTHHLWVARDNISIAGNISWKLSKDSAAAVVQVGVSVLPLSIEANVGIDDKTRDFACPIGISDISPPTNAPTSSTAEDLPQVDAALAGDSKAFGLLVRKHDAALRVLVYGMVRNATRTDDVLQDVYVKAYRSLASFRRESSFKTWIHRIAYTTTIDEIRKHQRITPINGADVLDEVADTSASTAQHVGNRMDVSAALGRLPERQRAVALLIDGHGFDYAEVARILAIPVGTVGFQLHNARKALRSALSASNEGEDR